MNNLRDLFEHVDSHFNSIQCREPPAKPRKLGNGNLCSNLMNNQFGTGFKSKDEHDPRRKMAGTDQKHSTSSKRLCGRNETEPGPSGIQLELMKVGIEKTHRR